ncbi:MAG: Copper metallochaperone, bacterial analog of Cox17 protein [uncultured Thiotrichaceae bacterium]|uniref:Copper metallochaperone, bacterial analog of Cox17 protein n=1 Tax=uncultured Thiotrichaceae bacterium TaxID=298394 RepID=A0A6S6T2N9_9GAMM|nr:MAG: Copper metallochaperone, bacterial analog of Cox17 protein [uncultured Thiotrichaceae bacterium]
MHILSKVFLISLALLSACNSDDKAQTGSKSADAISVDAPYIRAMPPGQAVTAMFLTLQNSSDKDRFLVSAKGDVSEKIELHEHTHADGMMKMREVPEITIPKQSKAELKPGGYHIMLIGLKKDLQVGEKISFDLQFKDGSQTSITAEVKKINPHS